MPIRRRTPKRRQLKGKNKQVRKRTMKWQSVLDKLFFRNNLTLFLKDNASDWALEDYMRQEAHLEVCFKRANEYEMRVEGIRSILLVNEICGEGIETMLSLITLLTS